MALAEELLADPKECAEHVMLIDLGRNDIGRVAMIRRTLAGAKRARPRVAILDRMAWDDRGSLAQVGARLDQPVDLISRTCRYDYAGYGLVVLPPDEIVSTSRGPSSLLPLARV